MPTRRRTFEMVAAAVVLTAVVVGGCDRDGSAESRARAPASDEDRKRPAAAAESTESAGESAGDDRYSTRVRPERIPVGSEVAVELRIEPSDGLKVNREYPRWSVEFDAPAGLEMAAPKLEREAFELRDSAAVAETRVTASEAGTLEVGATANFSVCNDETCHILRDEPVRFRLEAAEEGGSGAGTNGE